MSSFLCIVIRFLDPVPTFHGRRDGGAPEWPPSPLRLFQAIVDAAASRWRGSEFQSMARPALEWLQALENPTIIAPSCAVGTPYRIAVPNNDLDTVASAWSRRLPSKKEPSGLKTMKEVLPVYIRGASAGENVIHYLYPLSDRRCPHFDTLQTAARSVTHLGWGTDLVAGNAELLTEAEVADLKGASWQPVRESTGTPIRVPIVGTMDALSARHQASLQRISPAGFRPVPPLSAFRLVSYRRATDPAQQQFAAFSILKPDASGLKSFDPVCRTRDVAGMVRHAVAAVAKGQGWTDEEINVFVHGKTPEGLKLPKGQAGPDRFQYLPLPTINSALGRVESIRRVLVAAPPHCRQKIDWARRAMAGAELVNNDGVAALLTILPGSDWVLRQYVGESRSWSTVTPVILPGYDDPDHLRRKLKKVRDSETQKRYLDRLAARVDNLLRKAFFQAGYSREFIEQAELDWREVGFRAGVDLASRYLPPQNLGHSPRVHVRVRFPTAIRGPVAVGSGRFRGFGLFAIMDE